MRIESNVIQPVANTQQHNTVRNISKSVNNRENNNENLEYMPNDQQKQVSEQEIISAIEKANKEFMIYDRKFEFSIHERTKAIMVKVIDAKNDEIIREIPPEKILDMVAKLWELAGIIVDEKI